MPGWAAAAAVDSCLYLNLAAAADAAHHNHNTPPEPEPTLGLRTRTTDCHACSKRKIIIKFLPLLMNV